jgi:predicted metalloprotease
MRWRNRQRSNHIEDRRNQRGPSAMGIGGGGGLLRLLPAVVKIFGFKGAVIAVLAIGAYGLISGNLGSILGSGGSSQDMVEKDIPLQQSTAEKEMADFVSVVLADTEQTWKPIFLQMGKRYQEPKLVMFRRATQSACGIGQSGMGPFYCPGDHKVYIDLAFFNELKNRFKAPGDFAQAYVLAHEVGHHVQTLLGISQQVQQARRSRSKAEANQLLVRLELQADCYAGIWANHADKYRNMLESGDIEEGLNAASAIGDDRLQKQAQGYANPDTFTHGSSAQRVRWFTVGYKNGSMQQCDTFASSKL